LEEPNEPLLGQVIVRVGYRCESVLSRKLVNQTFILSDYGELGSFATTLGFFDELYFLFVYHR